MSRKSKADNMLPLIAFAGIVVFFLSKNAFGATPSRGNVQTATVGDRVYSVTRLGQGHYIVTLVSTGGNVETTPVNFAFNQTEQLGSIGPENKLRQLKSDMQSFNVNFSS